MRDILLFLKRNFEVEDTCFRKQNGLSEIMFVYGWISTIFLKNLWGYCPRSNQCMNKRHSFCFCLASLLLQPLMLPGYSFLSEVKGPPVHMHIQLHFFSLVLLPSLRVFCSFPSGSFTHPTFKFLLSIKLQALLVILPDIMSVAELSSILRSRHHLNLQRPFPFSVEKYREKENYAKNSKW